MRRFLLLLLLSLSIPNLAQEEGWPIVENCLGELPYPTIPQEDWDFEGVIFSYGDVGVRGIRGDLETPYIVAFEDDENFVATGSFSPDGNWFAYLTGEIQPSNDLGSTRHYIARGIAVVSGNPQQQRNYYQLPEEYFAVALFVSAIPYPLYFNELLWLDNENLIYTGNEDNRVNVRLNIATGEISTELSGVNFPVQRTSSFTDWMALDDGNYITTIYDDNVAILSIFNTNGELIEEIAHGNISDVSFSQQSQTLIFLKDWHIHVADLEHRTVEDLCFESIYGAYARDVHYNLILSPDGSHLAFLYDNYPVLVNLETHEMQILRYRTLTLMGWYPLEERYD